MASVQASWVSTILLTPVGKTQIAINRNRRTEGSQENARFNGWTSNIIINTQQLLAYTTIAVCNDLIVFGRGFSAAVHTEYSVIIIIYSNPGSA